MKSGSLRRATPIASRARSSLLLLLAVCTAGFGLAAPAAASSDVVPPDTFITMGPVPELTPGPLFFEFESTEEPGLFQCSLDSGAWWACASPLATTVTALGPHTLSVAAVDAAGNVDPAPATFSFTILPPTSEAATVSATAVSHHRRLRVDVDPDWAAGDYSLTVQRRKKGSWRTFKRTRTQGAGDVRTLDLRRGTYRVVIGAANSLSGVTSGPVRIKR